MRLSVCSFLVTDGLNGLLVDNTNCTVRAKSPSEKTANGALWSRGGWGSEWDGGGAEGAVHPNVEVKGRFWLLVLHPGDERSSKKKK